MGRTTKKQAGQPSESVLPAGTKLPGATSPKTTEAQGENTTGNVAPIAATRDSNVLSLDEARSLTGEIRAGVVDTLALLLRAYEGRAWAVLGYRTWDSYCNAEFKNLSVPRSQHAAWIVALRSQGMSTRAIAAAIDSSKSSVGRRAIKATEGKVAAAASGMTEVAPVPNGTPDKTQGMDGKTYPAKKQRSDSGSPAPEIAPAAKTPVPPKTGKTSDRATATILRDMGERLVKMGQHIIDVVASTPIGDVEDAERGRLASELRGHLDVLSGFISELETPKPDVAGSSPG
jgi:hypothetical protein